ncbi:DMT family transporter [Niveibacterium umoris]|uniref:Drug/metabolite transporter (DMT)-like permease n=1 Tax=Niveibacterium umoris TaxID=1193620 RepID=A0A840BGT5_9RHOO|nr:DMT family transporter [Niveibacterium umoris]MBB4011414.1 drug/metabolite transporter (DMT)-like permease [Niveibacterium umoris]
MRGVALFCVAVVLFACLDAIAKHLSRTWPVAMLAWGRYVTHFILMTVFLAPRWRGRLLASKRPLLQSLRGLSLVAVTVLAMAAFKRMPLAEATALLFASPLLVAILARPILGERIGHIRWSAIAIGFAGVLMLTRPGNGLDPLGVACALAAAVAYAAYQLMTRTLSSSEHPVTMLYYTALAGTLSLSALQPFLVDSLPWPGAVDAALIAALGVLGGSGHYLLTRAFRDAPASLLSPLVYTQLIWAALLGWIVFDNAPTAATLAGIAVIGTSGLLIAWDSAHPRTR